MATISPGAGRFRWGFGSVFRSEDQAAVDRALADFGAEDVRCLNELYRAAEQGWDDRSGCKPWTHGT